MLKSYQLFSIILCLATKSNKAQNGAVKIDTLLTGTWNGTSICQVKNSPCHDETVVYHISKNSWVDTFFINASKIVNGVEEEMGILPFVYNKKTNQLTSTAYGIWTFNIAGDKLDGTLLNHGDLYRKIKLYKHY
ncbi:MAG TPA: hypothetical protein VMY77_15810 [Chitinophagaceae bacterium]|nr:hypothetical protein [Chitinophagaceae bacterium]